MEYSSFEFKIGGEKGANVIFTDIPISRVSIYLGIRVFAKLQSEDFLGLTISSPILGKTRRVEPVMDFAGVNCNRRLA